MIWQELPSNLDQNPFGKKNSYSKPDHQNLIINQVLFQGMNNFEKLSQGTFK